PGLAQVAEDVLKELERDLLGLRDPLPLDGAVTGGGELDHRAQCVIHLCRDAHGAIVAHGSAIPPPVTCWLCWRRDRTRGPRPEVGPRPSRRLLSREQPRRTSGRSVSR